MSATTEQGVTYTARFHVQREEKGTVVLAFGEKSAPAAAPAGRIDGAGHTAAGITHHYEGLLVKR